MTNSVQLSGSNPFSADRKALRVAFVFSGQGSQSYLMAKDLYDRHAGFRGHMKYVDGLFEAALGCSVLQRLYGHEAEQSRPFDTILFALPSTFMVQHSMARALIERDVHPGLAVGASVGELTAAVIAGAVSLEDAVSSVAAIARLLDQSSLTGGMTAVLHDLELF